MIQGGCEKDARGLSTYGFPDRYMDAGERVVYSVAFQSAEDATELLDAVVSLRCVLVDADSPGSCIPRVNESCFDPLRGGNFSCPGVTVLDSPVLLPQVSAPTRHDQLCRRAGAIVGSVGDALHHSRTTGEPVSAMLVHWLSVDETSLLFHGFPAGGMEIRDWDDDEVWTSDGCSRQPRSRLSVRHRELVGPHRRRDEEPGHRRALELRRRRRRLPVRSGQADEPGPGGGSPRRQLGRGPQLQQHPRSRGGSRSPQRGSERELGRRGRLRLADGSCWAAPGGRLAHGDDRGPGSRPLQLFRSRSRRVPALRDGSGHHRPEPMARAAAHARAAEGEHLHRTPSRELWGGSTPGDPVSRTEIVDWAWNMSLDLPDGNAALTWEFDNDTATRSPVDLIADGDVMGVLYGPYGAVGSDGNPNLTGGFPMFSPLGAGGLSVNGVVGVNRVGANACFFEGPGVSSGPFGLARPSDDDVDNDGDGPVDELVTANGPFRNMSITKSGPDLRNELFEDIYGDTGNAFRGALGILNTEGTGAPAASGFGASIDDMVIQWREVRLDPDVTTCAATGVCATVSVARSISYDGTYRATITVNDASPSVNDCNGEATHRRDDDFDCNNNAFPDVVVVVGSDDDAGERVALDRLGATTWFRGSVPVSTDYDSPGYVFAVRRGNAPPVIRARYQDRDDGTGAPCGNSSTPALAGTVQASTAHARPVRSPSSGTPHRQRRPRRMGGHERDGEPVPESRQQDGVPSERGRGAPGDGRPEDRLRLHPTGRARHHPGGRHGRHTRPAPVPGGERQSRCRHGRLLRALPGHDLLGRVRDHDPAPGAGPGPRPQRRGGPRSHHVHRGFRGGAGHVHRGLARRGAGVERAVQRAPVPVQRPRSPQLHPSGHHRSGFTVPANNANDGTCTRSPPRRRCVPRTRSCISGCMGGAAFDTTRLGPGWTRCARPTHHLAMAGFDLSFKQRVSFVDSRPPNPEGRLPTRFRRVQLADAAGAPWAMDRDATPEPLHAGGPRLHGVSFDPIDDGNNEDTFYDPPIPSDGSALDLPVSRVRLRRAGNTAFDAPFDGGRGRRPTARARRDLGPDGWRAASGSTRSRDGGSGSASWPTRSRSASR